MSTPTLKHLNLKDVNGVTVVDFVNAALVYSSDIIHEIGEELNDLVTKHGHSRIVIDFSAVQYLSSMMLAKLAKLEQQVQSAKGQLKLCGLGPTLKDTFRIGRFERFFDIHDNVESALEAF